jgi:hypothetical protein
MSTLREQSRNCSLQRIADACEIMAKDRQDLINQLDYYKTLAKDRAARIDQKKLDWNELFSYNIPVSYHHEAPKFHQIPFELQFGILARFITIGMRDPLYNFQFDIELFKRQMKVVYEKIERGINNGKLDKK